MEKLEKIKEKADVRVSGVVFSGYGHKKVNFEITVGFEYKIFSVVTSSMPLIDEYNDTGDDDVLINSSIFPSDAITEWLSTLEK